MAVQIQVRSDSRQAQVDLKRLEASLNSVQTSAASINRSISGLATATKVAFAALPIAALGTAALRTAASFETLNARLVTATGSTQKAASAFIAVQKIVTKTPFSVKSLTDAYARLATTGSRVFRSQAQIERGIQNIADAVSAVGGGNVELRRVASAFERMASEGRITAERLNQITDAGIPLTKIAKSLGLTMEELRSESEKGTLTFARLYKAFQNVAEAADGFGGAAARQVNTLNGAFSNLGDAFDILADRSLRQSGLSKIFIRSIIDMTDSINNFSKGIELDIATAIFEITYFYVRARKLFKDIGSVIYELGAKTVSLIPTFNINPSELKSSIKEAFNNIDFKGIISSYKLKLNDFIPGLEDVKKSIFNFGKYIKDVFYDIWDTVVGNSTWPDLIKGVVEWAGKLQGLVKPHLESFKLFVINLFKEIQNKFNEITSKVSLEFNVSSDTTALSKVSAYLTQINTNIGKLISNAKQHPAVSKYSNSLEEVTKTILNSYKELAKTSSFQTLRGTFNSIAVVLSESLLPRLIALFGAIVAFAKVDPKALILEFNAVIDKVTLQGTLDDKLAGAVKEQAKQISKSLDDAVTGFKTKSKEGLTGFEVTGNSFNFLGDLLGKLVGDAFGTGVKNSYYTIQELLVGVVAFAFSAALRKIVGAAIVVRLVFGEQSFAQSLGKIYDLISQFGNRVLKGAGVPDYATDSGVGGFIAGLLFGGLALATITGKLVPILVGVAKLIGAYLIVPKLFEGKDANKTVNGAETFGQKTGRMLQVGMRAGFSAAGGVAALLAAEKFSDFFEIEDKLNRAFVEIGFSIGGAMAGAMIGGFLASSLIKGGAWIAMAFSLPVIKAALTRLALSTVLLGAIFPSVAGITTAVGGMLATLATALSAPVILAALGVAAGGFLLYNVLFGEEGSWGSKIKKLFSEQIIPSVKTFFTEIFDWMSTKLDEIGKRIKGFFTFNGQPSNNSQGGGLTADPMLGFASGGKVSGSGTGTSDSILARLSNGEYVVNAKATSQNRGLLERINNGLPAFNTGGYVGNFIRQAEGDVPRAYHDSLKLLTIGVGHLLTKSEAEQLKIPVVKNGKGYKAVEEPNVYPRDTVLARKNLNPFGTAGLNALFNQDLTDHIAKARREIPSLDSLPLAGKTAVIDHVYQMGSFSGWPRMKAKLLANDFIGASKELENTTASRQTPNRIKRRQALLTQASVAAFTNESMMGFANGGYVNDQDFDMVKNYINKFLGNVNDDYINNLLKGYKESGLLTGHLSTLRGMTKGYANGGYVNDQDFNMIGNYVRGFMGNVDDDYINNLLKQYKQTGQLEGHLSTLRNMTGGYANGGYVNDQDFDMVSKYIRSFIGNVDDSYINNMLKQYKQTGQLDGHLKVLREMTNGYANGGSISGPGTGTSDSILARLSNGEYVVNARATAMNRGLLERINAGLPAFAVGGPVGDIKTLAAQTGINLKGIELDKATTKELFEIKIALVKLKDATIKYNSVDADQQKDLKDPLQSLKDIAENRLVPLQQKSVEIQQAELDLSKATFAKGIGDASAKSVRGDFNTGLSSLLKGQSNIGDFGDTLLNSITGNIVDSFSAGITEGIFGKEGLNLESMFSGLFGEQAGIGFDLFGGSKVKTIGAQPTGRSGDPIYTAPDPMAGITLPPAGNNPDEAAVGQKSIFGDFTTKVEEVFNEGVEGFKGAFTDLGDSFTKLFTGFGNSITGLFSGGGGGGGLGGLFSGISSLFGTSTNFSIAANPMFGGFFSEGGIVPGGPGAVPIVAHAGEIVLNEAQQSRVAAAMQSRDSSSQQQVNINITGDISRQTRQEILTMSPQIAEMVRNNFIEKRVLK